MSVIPKKIHFFWAGGPLRPEYVVNIRSFMAFAKGYEVNLWIDKEIHYHQGVIISGLPAHPQPRLRDIKDIIPTLKQFEHGSSLMKQFTDFVFKKPPTPTIDTRNLSMIAQSELIGLTNYSAASDIFRYAILYNEGGIYADTDTIATEVLSQIEAKHGILFCPFFERPPEREEFESNAQSVGGNVTAATQHNEILRSIIITYINNYKILSESKVEIKAVAPETRIIEGEEQTITLATFKIEKKQGNKTVPLTIKTSTKIRIFDEIVTFIQLKRYGHEMFFNHIDDFRTSHERSIRDQLTISNSAGPYIIEQTSQYFEKEDPLHQPRSSYRDKHGRTFLDFGTYLFQVQSGSFNFRNPFLDSQLHKDAILYGSLSHKMRSLMQGNTDKPSFKLKAGGMIIMSDGSWTRGKAHKRSFEAPF